MGGAPATASTRQGEVLSFTRGRRPVVGSRPLHQERNVAFALSLIQGPAVTTWAAIFAKATASSGLP